MAVSVPLVRPQSGAIHRFLELELLDNRYPAIHGLRVFGIVSVVQWHVTQILVRDYHQHFAPAWSSTSFCVFFGMDLFFVLSGFLIGSILLRSLDTPRGQIGRFYLRRIFRTFPSYYVVLTYLALVTALTAQQRHGLIFEYTYFTNYYRRESDLVMPWGWSLALEEQFYLAVPFLLLLLRRVRGDVPRLALLGGLWLLPLALRLGTYLSHPGAPENSFNRLYFHTHTRADTLVAGLILAYVHWRWREPIGRSLATPFSRAMLAMPSLLCLWILMQPGLFGAGWLHMVHIFSWGTLTSIMYFGWILLVLHGRGGWIDRGLSLPVFRRIASLGYGIYLVHMPICDWLVSPVATVLVTRYRWSSEMVWVLDLAGTLAGAFVLSYVLHVLIEKPSLKLRDHFAS